MTGFAEIEEAVISALYDAFASGEDLSTEHVFSALADTVPLARTMDEQINGLRRWAEGRARHASVNRGRKEHRDLNAAQHSGPAAQTSSDVEHVHPKTHVEGIC